MTSPPEPTGTLRLGHILEAAGLDLGEVMVLRHTYTSGGLTGPSDLTPAKVLDYVRRQGIGNKLGPTPPQLWLNFIADGGRRSRFLTTYDNRGELPLERTEQLRHFDLRHSPVLSALADRLVIEWSGDAVNWAKTGPNAARFPVVEIADPSKVPFPGFDRVLISYEELRAVVEDSRYADWQAALASVQGIYVIADLSTGQLYVGKADGAERILGRWAAYARDGHGGNVALRDLAQFDVSHRQQFRFSILRVFGPNVPAEDVDEAESHLKQALLSRRPWGMNLN